MVLKRVSITIILLSSLSVWLPEWSSAQKMEIDTSSYLPLFYDNALEYNLMVAASMGYDKEVERMLLQGADADAQTDDEGVTPLIMAVSHIRVESVKVLLSYNADPNKATFKHETPLLVAVKSQNSAISKSFKDVGINIEYQNLEITEALIRYGADINYKDDHGVTPLHYASIYGYFYLVDLLIYYGADVDVKARDGTTPLMAAIWAGYTDIADLLIKNGANMEARDNAGFTPFLIAAQNGDTLMLHLLMKNGVDIYEKTIDNSDALSLSIRYGYIDAFKMLYKDPARWNDPKRHPIDYNNMAIRIKREEILNLIESDSISVKNKISFNQMAVSLSLKFTSRDYYTGLNLDFKESAYGFGIRTGFDTKLTYTKILIKKSTNLYFQYMDRSSLIYAGIFKDFRITNRPFKSNFVASLSLSAAYFFGSRFSGSVTGPESKFRLIPEVSVKWMIRNFGLYSGVEYMKTDFCRIGPVWGRIGLTYNFRFDFVRTPVKNIKWF